uniref:BTB domain-containing protein n=1 Tax=Psilocybe cubensis TaxID=181762 RepID=A0A8H8CR96_PSICU
MPAPVQLITPPDEEPSCPTRPEVLSISSSFFPGSHNAVSDIILRSSDAVLFYVNSQTILKTSKNAFDKFLGFSLDDKRFRDTIIDIPESAVVLNIIVHTLYGLSCAKHNPSYEDIETAINRMPAYGLIPKLYIVSSSPLFDLLLSHAPIYPIQIYSLAGHFGIHELAVKCSSHLLSYNLSNLTDETCKRMGPKYLKRLMCLHMNIIDSLKTIILQPPYPHGATRQCDLDEQKKLSRAWALAASYLAWDSRPDLSIHKVQTTFEALGDHLTCDDCKASLNSRIKEVVVNWVKVKRTI